MRKNISNRHINPTSYAASSCFSSPQLLSPTFLFIFLFYLTFTVTLENTCIIVLASSFHFDSSQHQQQEEQNKVKDEIKQSIKEGDLHKARSLSHDWLMFSSSSQTVNSSNDLKARKKEISNFYQDHLKDLLLEQKNGETLFLEKVVERAKLKSLEDDNGTDDWNYFQHKQCDRAEEDIPLDRISEAWDKCCSAFSTTLQREEEEEATIEGMNGQFSSFVTEEKEENTLKCHEMTCDLGMHSSFYLRLPLLNEPSLRIALPFDGDITYPCNENGHSYGRTSDEGGSYLLHVEQGAYLYPFNPSTVLWPAGYFLTLCLSAPKQCGIHDELSQALSFLDREKESKLTAPIAVELGVGIGLPSIALARWLAATINLNHSSPSTVAPLVVATDKSPHALSFSIENAYQNHVGEYVHFAKSDYLDLASIGQLKLSFFGNANANGETSFYNTSHCHDDNDALIIEEEKQKKQYSENSKKMEMDNNGSSRKGGFAIVLGSSLPQIFHNSDANNHLWNVLDELLDSRNPNSIAIFVHTIETKDLQVISPQSLTENDDEKEDDDDDEKRQPFECIKQISGLQFGMRTLHQGDVSDFMISVFRRRQTKMRL